MLLLFIQAQFEMEDFAIPEEYFSCHADRLFDLLADSLVTFAKKHGFRYCPTPTAQTPC